MTASAQVTRPGLRAALPLALTPLLALGVAIAGVSGVMHQVDGAGRGLGFVALALYLAWVVVEAVLATRPEARRPTGDQDGGTIEVYALARTATAVAAPALAGAYLAPPLILAGALVLALGVALRLAAIHALGASYSHRVRTPGALVTHGPYRALRHPAYSGMLLAHAGWVLAFPSPLAVLLLGLLGAALAARITVEERRLALVPGWAAYAQTRARLVPGVL